MAPTAQPRAAGLGRRERLRRRPDFLLVQERGRRYSGKNFLMLVLARTEDTAGAARLGITVSKKVGNAVVRNRVKRWVRESYRRTKGLAPRGCDLVVVARASAAASDYSSTAAELKTLLGRLGGR